MEHGRRSFEFSSTPYRFVRRQCFLCEAPAVAHVANEPVCATHRQMIEAIREDAAARERVA